MSRLRPVLHQVRNRAVRFASLRRFTPIESPANRILLVRPDHFGDMLMLAPAINAMQRYASDLEIVLITGPWNEAVASHVASVDQIVTYPFPGFVRGYQSGDMTAPYRAVADAAAVVRELKPVATVLLRDDHWWGALMAREAGVPLRFGYSNAQMSPFLTHPIDVRAQHYVEQNAELIAGALATLGYEVDPSTTELTLNWPLDGESERRARAGLATVGIESEFIALHPGSGAAVKLWPAERWALVADRLTAATGLPVVLTGSPDEAERCEAITSRTTSEPVSLAGQTTLFELAEIFRLARLVLGVDSGPLHLATAVGTRSVHLYGPSDHRRYGPWGDSSTHRIVSAGMSCPRCGDLSAGRPEGCGCMMAITPETVVRVANEVLNNDV